MKAQKLTRETINSLGIEKREFPSFAVGDAIAISQWITEGNKKRIQVFEGDVIALHQNGASSTFTVRKIGANSIAVERIYPYYSPIIDSIAVVRKGDVRRAKLYYLRDRVGKKARVKERILTKEQKAAAKQKENKFDGVDSKKVKKAAPKKVETQNPVEEKQKQDATKTDDTKE